MDRDDSLYIDHPAPRRRVRIVCGLAVVLAIILQTFELRHAFLQPSIVTAFFGIILLGSWALGSGLVIAAATSSSTIWIVRTGQLTIEMRHPWARTKVISVPAGKVADTSIVTETWDNQADTYLVEVSTVDGRKFRTRSFSSTAAAIAMEDAIRERLRLTQAAAT